jgi:hypothetical protein
VKDFGGIVKPWLFLDLASHFQIALVHLVCSHQQSVLQAEIFVD